MLTICAIGDANVGFLYEKSILYYTKDIFELTLDFEPRFKYK